MSRLDQADAELEDALAAAMTDVFAQVADHAERVLRDAAVERPADDDALTAAAGSAPFVISDDVMYVPRSVWEPLIDGRPADLVSDLAAAGSADAATVADAADDPLQAAIRANVARARDLHADLQDRVAGIVRAAVDERTPLDTTVRRLREIGLGRQSAELTADMIARSSTNAGLTEAWAADPDIAAKQWNTVGDDRVRETHAALEGVQVALGSTFNVGGFPGEYPGDPALPIDQVAHERCWLRPVTTAGRPEATWLRDAGLRALQRLAAAVGIAGRSRATATELRSEIRSVKRGDRLPLDQLSLRQLRSRAGRLDIPGRWRMDRIALIAAIAAALRRQDDDDDLLLLDDDEAADALA